MQPFAASAVTHSQMGRAESSQPPDDVLVERYLRDRDEKSFRELYGRYAAGLYALATRLTASEADAHDAMQETWIRACRALRHFEWKSSLRTWLTGILINCVRELERKSQRRHEEQLEEESLGPSVAPPEAETNLERAIARLPRGYRHVLTLHDVEGYTHEEISTLLGISVGTSKSQLHHARQTIRAIFHVEQLR